MTWTDQSSLFGFGTVLSSLSMQNLRDNNAAQAAGDAGAPTQKDASLEYPVNRVLVGSVTKTTSWQYAEFLGLLNNSYANYQLDLYGTFPSADNTIYFQLSQDSGSTWIAGTNYDYIFTGGTIQTGNAQGRISHAYALPGYSYAKADFSYPGSSASGNVKGVMTDYISINGTLIGNTKYGNTINVSAGGYNSVRIYPATNQFDVVNAKMYGIR